MHTKEPFKLKPPTRADITEWTSQCWTGLSKQTIVSGFAMAGILGKTLLVGDTIGSEIERFESDIV
ncbi:hypothetical protein L917_16985 [Phytophthora nicotianae]|nr:hypothetical protein L917_16985 [Phytophthora nicotianae]